METFDDLKDLSIEEIQKHIQSNTMFSSAEIVLLCHNIDIQEKDVQILLSSYYVWRIFNNYELKLLSYNLIHNFDFDTFVRYKQLLKHALKQEHIQIYNDLKSFKLPQTNCPEFEKHYDIQRQIIDIATKCFEI